MLERKRGTQQTRLENFAVQKFSEQELVVLACAAGLHAFSFAEEVFFRKAFKTVVSDGETIGQMTRELAARLSDEVLPAFGGRAAWLCADSGTVFGRYFVVVLAAAGLPPLLVRAVHDSALEGGAQTIENIATVLGAVVEELGRKGVHICAICGDNAANVQDAITQVETALKIRCAAHCIQLCVHDGAALTDSLLAMCAEISADHQGWHIPSSNKTL